MDLTNDFAGAQRTLSQALIQMTRSATHACAQDTAFYGTIDPELGSRLDRQSSRLLSLTQGLLRRCPTPEGSTSLTLSDAESIDTNWKYLVDVTDGLLERTAACLDEYDGLIKRSSPRGRAHSPTPANRLGSRKHQFRTQNIAKPQIHFDVKPRNNEADLFKPILTSKPNALIALEQSQAVLPNKFGDLQYQHPYALEIENYNYPSFVYTEAEPQAYMDFESTTAKFVDSLEGVYQMLEELKKAPVIAIDLEHHDAHSYAGIVSLMQISTRRHDWLIDTLRPWRHKLEILNEVFTDPKILKIFHGAHMDTFWLQRDFGLYVVGLFDTYHASRVLGYPGASLAFLLKKFINFDAQKQYQTADWRVRPLPREMFDYARSDTHFLLYIFDCMRNELIASSKIDESEEHLTLEVLRRSKETAAQRYEHSVYDKPRGRGRGGWFNLLHKTWETLSREQFAVFRKIHEWRDRIARQEDESPLQIMPNNTMFSVSRILPRDLPALVNVLNPLSPLLRSRVSEVLNLVHTAIVEATEEPEPDETVSSILKKIGNAPLSSQLQVECAKLNTSTAPDRIDRESTVNVRADFSCFWGSTLVDYNKAGQGKMILFEATPRILDRAVDQFDTEVSRTDVYQTKGSPSISNTHNLTPTKSQIVTPSSTLEKCKADSINGGGVAAVHKATHNPPMNVIKLGHPDSADNVEGGKSTKRGSKSTVLALQTSRSSTTDLIASDPHFDYSTAPSVLNNNQRQIAETQDHRAVGDKPFNLYTKSNYDGPSLKKTSDPPTGRSATYKE